MLVVLSDAVLVLGVAALHVRTPRSSRVGFPGAVGKTVIAASSEPAHVDTATLISFFLIQITYVAL